MKIYLKNKTLKNEVESYIKYISNFKITNIQIDKKDKLYINNYKNKLLNISKRKQYKFKPFNFNYNIIIDKKLSYMKIVTENEKEYIKLLKYIITLYFFFIKFKFSKKSSMIIDGKTITNKTGFVLPIRKERELGYECFRLANII